MANNDSVLADIDGDFSDWIEIYNDSSETVNLAGWRLTDDDADLEKWEFPSVNLAPRSFLVVFASEKNRAVAGSQLHTNFALSSEGEYLALVRPDDTIATETDYPQQSPNVSYGLTNEVESVSLLSPGSAGRLHIPIPAGPLPPNWTTSGFDHGGWTSIGGAGTGGIGYDTGLSEAVSPQAATLAQNPLGYWRMTETAGVAVANLGSLGTTANGTVAGAANLNVAGPQPATFPGFEATNSAMNFDGVNDAVDVGGAGFLSNASAFTVMGWIRPAAFTATRVGLFGQNDAIEFGFIDGAASTVQIWTPGGGSLNVNYPFARGTWHHVAAVGDGTAIRMYFDGNLVGTVNATTNNYGTSGSGFRIGGNGVFDATGNFFTGDIDEVAAFNRALTQAQVQSIVGAATQGAGAPGGTVAYAPHIQNSVQSAMLNVNATALVRIPVNITGSADFDTLTLKMRYDDGFVAFLNGIEVARRNAPATLAANSVASAAHEDSQAILDELIDISTFADVLEVGENVLAIHALNSAANNTDFLLNASLEGRRITELGTELRYFTTSTPGTPNGVGTADLGPIISNVTHAPNQPLQNEPIVVQAKVSQSFNSVATVQMRYRVMYNAEIAVNMIDDGSVGGDIAGDGIYTAVIPGSIATPGQMIRWRVTASDSGGNNSRWPLFNDPLNSEEYLGTVVVDPALDSDLPVFHWFLPPGQQGAADSDAGARSALFYDGEFYDNVRFDVHGQSTRGFPKKSYDVDFNSDHRFRLSDDLPRMKDINILSNYADKTRLRNTLAYETFRDSGSAYHLAFPIRVQQNGVFFSVADFVEDGDDVFLERLGRNPDGALYKMYNTFDSATGEKKTRRDEGNADLEAFRVGVTQANVTTRTNFMWDNVNMPAMISYMAGTMVASNYDCCHKNYYLYRDVPVSEGGTGEWEMMPWDVDLSWGKGWSQQAGYLHNQMTPDFPLYQGEADVIDQPLSMEVSKRNNFLNPLFNTPGVRNMYLRRVRTLMDQLMQPASTPVDQRVAEQRIDELVALIGNDGLLDAAKWGTWQDNGDWATQITMLKNDYLGPRRTYLYNTLSAILPPPQPADATVTIGAIEFSPTSGNQDQEYVEIVNNNTFAIDISDWTIEGDIDHTFVPGTVIPANGKLYLTPSSAAFRARTTGPRGNQGLFVQGGIDGHLSSFGGTLTIRNSDGIEMTSTTFPGDPSPVQEFLRITEMMYHPSNPTTAEIAQGFTNDNAFEYVELQNTSTTEALDLAGVRFTAGIAFDFTGSAVTSLLPGGRVLVVRDPGGFAARYGMGPGPIAGVFAGSLDNSGERIKIDDASNGTVLEFEYNDAWHPLTDGPGFSMVARDALQDRSLWGEREGWMPSYAMLGSPGVSEPSTAPLPGAVAINEIMNYGTGVDGDRIELRNTTSAPIDISGWYLTTSDADLDMYQLPTLPAIQPGGYLVLSQTAHWGAAMDLPVVGGTIILQGQAGGTLFGYQARQDFAGSDPNKSFGPHAKPDGDVDFVELVSSTFGAANTAPRVGPVVINEIMYGPAGDGDEYIEIKNISATTVNLADWMFFDAIDYTFPAATIDPGEYVIVASIDPTAFRTKYAIPLGIEIVGPFTGSLNNAGDDLRLYRPGDEGALVLIDRVNYQDAAPWPTRPDGGGTSLGRSVAGNYGNDPTNWVSDIPGGTPGGDNGFFDDTAPTTPTGLSAAVVAGPDIALSWNASIDPQSGVGQYLIYRDGALLATTAGTSYVDATAVSGVAYSYQVAAANPSQVSSVRSGSTSASILDLVAATSLGPNSVRITFNGAVDTEFANTASNFTIAGVTVSAAAIQAGGASVLLTTSALVDGNGYRVVANNVKNTFGQSQLSDRQTTFTAGGVAGLVAQYYNDPNSTDPATKLQPGNLVLTRVDPNINFNWSTASPAPGVVNTDRFSVRWVGQLETLEAGDYRIDVTSSDGIRVWVDNQTTPVIDKFVGGGQSGSSAAFHLDAFSKVAFKVEYFEQTLTASAVVRWFTPSGGSTAVAIPASQFSHLSATETTAPQISEIFVASSGWTDEFKSELAAQGWGASGVNVPVGSTTAVLPWTNLNQVKVRFDSDVLASASSLLVNGTSIASYGVADFSYDYTTFTGTWTLAAPIALDRATIGFAGLTDIVGNSLSAFPTTTLRVAAGDVTGDGAINSADRVEEIARQFTTIGHANYALRHDINGDGYINAHDAVLLQQRFGASLPAPSPSAAAAVVRGRTAAPADGTTPVAARRNVRAELAARRVAIDHVLTESGDMAESSSTAKLRARRVTRASMQSVDGAFELPTL